MDISGLGYSGACKQSKDPEGANQGRSVIRTVQRVPLMVRNAPRFASGESAFGGSLP